MNSEHLSRDLILRFLDDEVTRLERAEAEAHLAACEVCSREIAALNGFSLQIESAVQSVPLPEMGSVRQHLVSEFGSRSTVLHQPGKVLQRFGWGMGLAATLALGVLLAPRHETKLNNSLAENAPVISTSTIEVDGETFLPVPYSNSELSTAAPHIVQMQVPVSSLADVGIVFEPVVNRVSSSPDMERSVLADVLIGADGQPRGVHVLEVE